MVSSSQDHAPKAGDGDGSLPVPPAETVEDVLREIIPADHHCGPVMAKGDQFERLEAAFERLYAEQAARMPDVQSALYQMGDAFARLKKLGWKEAIYCPKDGSTFDVIEAGSTGIHTAHYQGEWPKGGWWVHAEGDLWPSRPILWRPTPKTLTPDDGSGHCTESTTDASQASGMNP